MSWKSIVARSALFSATCCLSMLFAQQRPAVSGALEFPVTMRQNVVAGKTPVGTKIEANLTIATLVDGKVIPVGAIFSGEVVESAAKSAASPSRLCVRMDSVRWKNGSASIKAYLSAWYYPVQMALAEDGPDERPPTSEIRRNRSSSRAVPPGSLDFPDSAANTANHRMVMKDVESVASTRDRDSGTALTSGRLNIKLDKTTTYVLATGSLTTGK